MAALTLEYVKTSTGEFDIETVFQAILTHRSFTRIGAVDQCCNLRWLDLSHNQIIRMENLTGLAQLVYIDLSFNKIPKVEGLEGAPGLQRLKLRSNPVARVQDLEGLRSAKKLKHLHFQNIDRTDFCPVCLQPEYQRKVRDLCPELVALDSRRWHLPNLDEEVQRLERHQEISCPAPEPWFTPEDLDLSGLQGPERVARSMRPHIEDFESALASCQEALREAGELLKLQELVGCPPHAGCWVLAHLVLGALTSSSLFLSLSY